MFFGTFSTNAGYPRFFSTRLIEEETEEQNEKKKEKGQKKVTHLGGSLFGIARWVAWVGRFGWVALFFLFAFGSHLLLLLLFCVCLVFFLVFLSA